MKSYVQHYARSTVHAFKPGDVLQELINNGVVDDYAILAVTGIEIGTPADVDIDFEPASGALVVKVTPDNDFGRDADREFLNPSDTEEDRLH